MQKLYFPPKLNSPEICLSPEEKLFFIRGISSPEDVREIYYPVIEWLRNFIDSLLKGNSYVYTLDSPLKFQVDLKYFNSSSAKFLYDIFLELKLLKASGIPVTVEWIYDAEDQDLKEAGSEISSLVEMQFTYISKTK